jgi:5'-deoxynucleotidase YfbR-like HD superfamily hydrolase
MTLAKIREKIMTDDEFVLSELKTIVSYYQLKHTIRWSHTRDQDETESVAEHVYGMHILVDYFLPLLKEEGLELDENYVKKLVNWHDMAEAFVGDMTTRSKTEEHKQKELESEEEIKKTGPEHL